LGNVKGIISRMGANKETLRITTQFTMSPYPAPYPADMVRQLETVAEKARIELGDSATRREGKGVGPAGKEPKWNRVGYLRVREALSEPGT
jgi:hypothetical protein